MAWYDDALDWADEHIVEPVQDVAQDAEDWVEDHVVDPIVDGATDVWDDIENAWEDVKDFAQKVREGAERAAAAIEGAWDTFKEKISDAATAILRGMEAAWDSFVNGLSSAADWLKEQVDNAVEWLQNAANAVIRFVVDELIPWVVSVIRLPWVLVKLLGALLAFAACWIVSKFTAPEPVRVIEAITDHHPRTLSDFKLARLPVNQPYVVFSDHHMFVRGDLNFYQDNGNAEIHQWLLARYASRGFHLIENGDVEDFWMRGGSARGHILDVAESLPYPFHYEAFCEQGALSAQQLHAVNVFVDNAATYRLVNDLFVRNNRYTRTIGNHDDVWDRSEMEPMFDMVYEQPVQAHDYILLDNPGGETEVVIAHGHQSDVWNMELCNFAGKTITDGFSTLREVSFGLLDKVKKFYRTRSEWQADLGADAHGFDNELHGMEKMGLGQSLDEIELYEALEDMYGDSPRQPYLVLGHTHSVRDEPGVPDFMFKPEWNWREYSNSGTTGMWEELVFSLEIVYPTITAVAWYKDDAGNIVERRLSSQRFGEVYLN